jgi:hypothetical protein
VRHYLLTSLLSLVVGVVVEVGLMPQVVEAEVRVAIVRLLLSLLLLEPLTQ